MDVVCVSGNVISRIAVPAKIGMDIFRLNRISFFGPESKTPLYSRGIIMGVAARNLPVCGTKHSPYLH